MYKIEDLDEPIRLLEDTIEEVRSDIVPFSIAVLHVVQQISKIEAILLDIQKKITGDMEEIKELIYRINTLDKLSERFTNLLDKKESEFMYIPLQNSELILPS